MPAYGLALAPVAVLSNRARLQLISGLSKTLEYFFLQNVVDDVKLLGVRAHDALSIDLIVFVKCYFCCQNAC